MSRKQTIKPKPRSRYEFVRLFLDESYSQQACYYWLNKEIDSNPELKKELETLGYKKGSHFLTIPQQNCIFAYFGLNVTSEKF